MLASTSQAVYCPPATRTVAAPAVPSWLESLSEHTSSHDSKILIPPREFSRVAPDIYASCLPHPRAVPFLNNLKIRSALFFATKQHPLNLELNPDVRHWITSLQEHRWSPIDKTKGYGKIAISQAGAQAAVEYILKAPKPLLLSGFDNIETCGLVIACLRKLQCWDMSSIEDELQRYLPVSLEPTHLRFINQFCASIPPAYLAGLPEHIQKSYAHLINASSHPSTANKVLHLPSSAHLPDWLWCGCSSPAELLQVDDDDPVSPGTTWHPTMYISIPS
ncbi:hypothetical protein P389DRAFT_198924 [Cystobasidium minutum MCA 4210]|uniref:uncharacterized protein n=1 Tax=Cystobasidium minutum MCA 4210 TaxID=1397322 RepID=UPI0034CF16B4|eukprot:jgi/Rhomi1/198924/gm1.7138_g